MPTLEKETKTRIRSIKAYSSVRDRNARFPSKNITEVAPTAMLNTPEEDDFTHLVLGAPTVDISNLDTSKLTSNDDTASYKQKIVLLFLLHLLPPTHPVHKLSIRKHRNRVSGKEVKGTRTITSQTRTNTKYLSVTNLKCWETEKLYRDELSKYCRQEHNV